MNKERAPWPQCYYDELDARRRKEMLDSAIENGEGNPEENAVRQKLWALRYGQPKKNMPPADGYAGLWITMNLWSWFIRSWCMPCAFIFPPVPRAAIIRAFWAWCA